MSILRDRFDRGMLRRGLRDVYGITEGEIALDVVTPTGIPSTPLPPREDDPQVHRDSETEVFDMVQDVLGDFITFLSNCTGADYTNIVTSAQALKSSLTSHLEHETTKYTSIPTGNDSGADSA